MDASVTLANEQSSADTTIEHAFQAMFRDVDLALARLVQDVGREPAALDALLLRLTDKPA